MPGNYPDTVAEVLSDTIRYRRATIVAVRVFASRKAWRGVLRQRQAKVLRLHRALCRVYRKGTSLAFRNVEGQGSGSSCFQRHADRITLQGRLSVVTYLHEFAHALGRDERGACRWSLNLFRQVFPRSFARLARVGHTVVVERGE